MVDIMNFDITPDNDEEEFAVNFGEVQRVGGGGGTSDFNQLTNRPKYNDQKMTGDTNIPEVPAKTSDLTNDGADGTSTYVEANDLAKVAATGEYGDLSNTPTIPIVNDATLTITQNGTSKGTFTANDSDDTTIELSDTTYFDFVGTDGQTAGAAGLVPAPATTDVDKFLKSDGTWDTAGGGGPTVVQTTGTSTTDVMSQNATTSMIYADPNIMNRIKIGRGANTSIGDNAVEIGHDTRALSLRSVALGSDARVESWSDDSIALGPLSQVNGADQAVSIGYSSFVNAAKGVALGRGATVNHSFGVALGAGATTSAAGEINVGTGSIYTTKGYNGTNYRLISGVHDGQNAHDAVTVNQINNLIDAINTAAGLNISHIGA